MRGGLRLFFLEKHVFVKHPSGQGGRHDGRHGDEQGGRHGS